MVTAEQLRAVQIEADVVSPAGEVVVPVRDEARVLERSIRRLHAYLTSSFPFSFLVTIADNGSVDGTRGVAAALAAELPHVRAVGIDREGRGRAPAPGLVRERHARGELHGRRPLHRPRKIHYFLGGGRGFGGSSASEAISSWVAEHFTATTVGGVTVYDLTAPSS